MILENIRKLLLPFAWLYGSIVWLRNKFFDWGWFSSKCYDFPVICVGNLSVGGTGKSPMVEYLIHLLKDNYSVATLSRGYKRETTGYYLLTGMETAKEVGDEPLQFKTKFPDIRVAVDGDRRHGIEQLRKKEPQSEIIILDDAFQHRKVRSGLSILLTSYDAIYKTDRMLPAGNLREPKSGARRAQIVVISKCPPDISKQEQSRLKKKLNLNPNQSLFFSTIAYADHVINDEKKMALKSLKNFCLVTGIAKPKPLVNYLKAKNLNFKHKCFPDHHNFTAQEITLLKKEEFLLTTEKDFMRLKAEISSEKLFYLPINQKFISDKKGFSQRIIRFIDGLST